MLLVVLFVQLQICLSQRENSSFVLLFSLLSQTTAAPQSWNQDKNSVFDFFGTQY